LRKPEGETNVSGTFVIDRSKIGQVIDTNCFIKTITFLTAANVVEPTAYEPKANGRPISGTFCLCDDNNYENFNWNFDVLSNGGMLRNVKVTITPTPPAPTKLISSLVVTSCPIGASFSVETG
jgi:hypothetical protein